MDWAAVAPGTRADAQAAPAHELQHVTAVSVAEKVSDGAEEEEDSPPSPDELSPPLSPEPPEPYLNVVGDVSSASAEVAAAVERAAAAADAAAATSAAAAAATSAAAPAPAPVAVSPAAAPPAPEPAPATAEAARSPPEHALAADMAGWLCCAAADTRTGGDGPDEEPEESSWYSFLMLSCDSVLEAKLPAAPQQAAPLIEPAAATLPAPAAEFVTSSVTPVAASALTLQSGVSLRLTGSRTTPAVHIVPSGTPNLPARTLPPGISRSAQPTSSEEMAAAAVSSAALAAARATRGRAKAAENGLLGRRF